MLFRSLRVTPGLPQAMLLAEATVQPRPLSPRITASAAVVFPDPLIPTMDKIFTKQPPSLLGSFYRVILPRGRGVCQDRTLANFWIFLLLKS